jgi:hypothetical protein
LYIHIDDISNGEAIFSMGAFSPIVETLFVGSEYSWDKCNEVDEVFLGVFPDAPE